MENGGKKKIKVDDIKKENVFSVPEGYFEALPHQIQAKAVAQGKKSFHFTFAYKALAGLAVVVIALLFGIKIFNKQEPTIARKEPQVIQTIPQQEVADNSISNTVDSGKKQGVIEKEDLAPTMEDNKHEQVQNTTLTSEDYLAEFNEEDIKDYLITNYMDELENQAF